MPVNSIASPTVIRAIPVPDFGLRVPNWQRRKHAYWFMPAPGQLTPAQRDASAFVIWNTADDFDLAPGADSETKAIMAYHVGIARYLRHGHWFVPFHPTLRLASFWHEHDAFAAANPGTVLGTDSISGT